METLMYGTPMLERLYKPDISIEDLVGIINKKYPKEGKENGKFPPGFCYVCSRLDPSGKHRGTPHANLFGKGYINQCMHQPRTPYPTLIEDEQEQTFQRQSSNPEWNFGVSVTFKGRHPSPDKNRGQKMFSTATIMQSNLDENGNIKDPSKYHLPPVFSGKHEKVAFHNSSGRYVPVIGEKTFAEAGPLTIEISNSGLHRTVALQISDDEESDKESEKDEKNEKDTDKDDEDIFHPDNARRIASRSTDVESIPSKPHLPSTQSHLPPLAHRRGNLVSFGVIHDDDGDPHRVIINDLESSRANERKRSRRWVINDPGEPAKSKLRTGRANDKKLRGQTREKADKAKNGHLKYKHRDEFSSLPHDGNDLSLDGSKLKTENTYGSLDDALRLTETPSMIIQRMSESGQWCECSDIERKTHKCSECMRVGSHEKWCSFARSNSRHGTCPKCNKPFKPKSLSSRLTNKRGSISTTKSEDINMLRRKRSTLGSSGKNSHHHVRFEDEDERDVNTPYTTKSMDEIRNRNLSDDDEDYMDYNDLAFDSDGNILTLSAQQRKAAQQKKDKEGLQKPQPWPTFDPNIHRDAYIKALTARSLEKLKKYSEIDEKIFSERLVKPHVFSYFKLRPHQKNSQPGGPDNIGIRPAVSRNFLPRKAMSHIFGKIKVDDFYPGGKNNRIDGQIIPSKKERKKKKAEQKLLIKSEQ